MRLRGNNRRAVVRSDIALRLPTLTRPIFFHAETVGSVPDEPPTFPPSVSYPWLTPNTFNGWFIPEGSTKRLGEMEFEESLRFDFRAKSLGLLLERIEELTAGLNFGARHHVRRRSESEPNSTKQMLLFPTNRERVILVIGAKCAGKSTFSDFAVSNYSDVFSIEASRLLRRLAEAHGALIASSRDALSYLRDAGLDIVARDATSVIIREDTFLYIVTGLRAVEEVLFMCKAFRQATIILVEADQRTRFERHIKRARGADARSFQEFKAIDEEEARFGVLRVANEIADIIVRNDDDIPSFQRRIAEAIGTSEVRIETRGEETEMHRSIRALSKIGRAATCDEIARTTEQLGVRVRKYNTNRALKSIPEFATRVTKSGQLLKYRLTQQGAALLELMELLQARRSGRKVDV